MQGKAPTAHQYQIWGIVAPGKTMGSARFSEKIPGNRLLNTPPKLSKAATSIDTKSGEMPYSPIFLSGGRGHPPSPTKAHSYGEKSVSGNVRFRIGVAREPHLKGNE
jgi:hypothetical protein